MFQIYVPKYWFNFFFDLNFSKWNFLKNFDSKFFPNLNFWFEMIFYVTKFWANILFWQKFKVQNFFVPIFCSNFFVLNFWFEGLLIHFLIKFFIIPKFWTKFFSTEFFLIQNFDSKIFFRILGLNTFILNFQDFFGTKIGFKKIRKNNWTSKNYFLTKLGYTAFLHVIIEKKIYWFFLDKDHSCSFGLKFGNIRTYIKKCNFGVNNKMHPKKPINCFIRSNIPKKGHQTLDIFTL